MIFLSINDRNIRSRLGPDRNSGPVEFGPVPVPVSTGRFGRFRSVPVDLAGTRPVPRFFHAGL